MNKDKYIVGLIGLAVGILIGALVFHGSATKLGTQVQNETFNFTGGINVGTTNQFAVDGSGNLTASGSLSQLTGFVMNGSVSALSPTGTTTARTLTAAEVCASTLITMTPAAGTATITFPATSTALFATCLPSIGSTKLLNYTSISTSTIIAAGAGGTLGYDSSTTVAAGKYAELRLIRNAKNTYLLWIKNITN